MIYVKKHKSETSEVTAICDEDLIGKKFKGNKIKINITERFYKGDLLEDNDVIKTIETSNNINIIGKNSINLALKIKLIEKNEVRKIQDTPFAFIFRL